MIRKAIIPAAGFGTRMRPISNLLPKEMLPIGGKVVLQHVIEECDAAGVDTLLVVINRAKTVLFPVGEETEGPRDPTTGVGRRSVYYASQPLNAERPEGGPAQTGLAYAMLHGEGFAGGDSFVMALGDTVIHGAAEPLLRRMVRAHEEHGAAATVAAQVVGDEGLGKYGIFEPIGETGETFRVRRIVEKPGKASAPSHLAVTARYVFSPRIFEACRHCGWNKDDEIELTQAISWLAEQGETVLGVRLAPGEKRLDIGDVKSYEEAFRTLSQ